jgi:two-component system sensor histidine kinase RegB
MALSILSNVGVALWLRNKPPVTERSLGALMALDLCLFTGLLYFTGGPFNPFSSLYLVHLALAALVLSSRWTWSLVLLAVAANAALFFRHVPLPVAHHGEHAMVAPEIAPPSTDHLAAHGTHGAGDHPSHHKRVARPLVPAPEHEPLDKHLQGMWVAFGVTAGFIVYFLNRVIRALAQRDEELARISAQTARAERLASVATLAAGAAHELSTPLATIAVAAKELERGVTGNAAEDARLIREQVNRCRDIVSQMAGDAGASPGEAPSLVGLQELVAAALGPIEERSRVHVSWGAGSAEGTLVAPLRAVSQALRNVVQNALDASEAGQSVSVDIRQTDEGWCVMVADEGSGIAPDVINQVTDPFFTTKEPGRGMGLGLFLARSVLDFLGGKLDIDSTLGKGTRVTLCLPSGPATPRPSKEAA